MLTALNLELPVVWDSSAADWARVEETVWVPVAVQGSGSGFGGCGSEFMNSLQCTIYTARA